MESTTRKILKELRKVGLSILKKESNYDFYLNANNPIVSAKALKENAMLPTKILNCMKNVRTYRMKLLGKSNKKLGTGFQKK